MIIDLDGAIEHSSIDVNLARVKAYHCTRGFQNDIACAGLKRFNFEERVEYFRQRLQDYGVCEKRIDEYLHEVRDFIGHEEIEGRGGIVCFFLNRGFFEKEDEGEQFFRYFGGEAMYRVAECDPRYGEVKAALENIGQPLVVTAAIELKRIKSYQIDKVLKFLRGESTQYCEAYFSGDVPPSNILSIEQARK